MSVTAGPALCLALLCICAASAAAASGSLRDHPIATSGSLVYLDGKTWTATGTHPTTAATTTIPASVPGDLLTDLERAGLIGDPLYELNFLNTTFWGDGTVWTYRTNFTFPSSSSTSSSSFLLVLEGVKMHASVAVDGKVLGSITNQFTRTVLPLAAPARPNSVSSLAITFDPALDATIDNRFMACTGGWDWAPITSTNCISPYTGTSPTFSRGIWKSVYVVELPANTPAITYVTPHTFYGGPYPTTPLRDGAHGGFRVNVTTHLYTASAPAHGELAVTGDWGVQASSGPVTLPIGFSTVTVFLNASAEQIRLWWPNGVGPSTQPLYNITTTWMPSASSPSSSSSSPSSSSPSSSSSAPPSATRRLGFRVAALVTANDSDPSVLAQPQAAGSGNVTMFFRINGAPILARGASLIPMEELEGRLNADAYSTLVRSVADGRMNMVRVWGGGIYPPDAFYDACDEHGILLYHDMQFAGKGHSAENASSNATLVAEVQHQVRRLSHHPAIVMWDGNNEIIVNYTGPSNVYASVIMTTVAREDASRVIWPASPAAGWVTGVNRLYGTPNGQKLVPVVGRFPHIWSDGNERHGTYTAGTSSNFPTVCLDPWTQALTFSARMPLTSFKPTPPDATGIQHHGIFTSEFGTVSMSSFESMAPTLAPTHLSLHGGSAPPDTCSSGMTRECDGPNPMAQRNWACDNVIWSIFGRHWVNASGGEQDFKAQLFQCMVGSALAMQQNIVTRRAGNDFGSLVWQLNEIWPTGGWGSLEYGTVGFTAGQVLGGRWKPLHYLFRRSLFTDVLVGCGVAARSAGASLNLTCYVSNDRAGEPFTGTVTLYTLDLQAGTDKPQVFATHAVALPAGPRVLEWFFPMTGNTSLPNRNTTLLAYTAVAQDGSLVSEDMIHINAPAFLEAPDADVRFAIAPAANADGSVNITVSTDKHALFVTLTSMAQGRFSDNTFLLPGGDSRLVLFVPFRTGTAAEDLATLQKTLRLEHHAMYM